MPFQKKHNQSSLFLSTEIVPLQTHSNLKSIVIFFPQNNVNKIHVNDVT